MGGAEVMGMTPRAFCFWAKGYLEGAQKSGRLSPHETLILERLATVEMPPRPPEPWCWSCGVADGQPHTHECQKEQLLAEGLVE